MQTINIPLLVLCVMAISGCSEKAIEEFAFRKSLEYHLTELCGEDAEDCVIAVKEQTGPCMKQSDWYKFVKDQDNKAEKERFITAFYACIVDPEGNPYFVGNTEAETESG